jgi:hypothetical protein
MSPGSSEREPTALERADLWIEIAWRTGVAQAVVTAAILLLTGRNILLSAHYPLVSALAVLLLALAVRRGSLAAAVLLFLGVLAPPVVKLMAGVLQPEDVPGLPLAAVYGFGVAGTFRRRRARKRSDEAEAVPADLR